MVMQFVLVGYCVFVYLIDGMGFYGFERQVVDVWYMVVYGDDGDIVMFVVGDMLFDLLLIGGVLFNELIVCYGLFVMNIEEEIWQVVVDYQIGCMGCIEV